MNSRKSINPLIRLGRTLYRFFDMPSLDQPTLPEALLARTGLRSWLLASWAVGAGVYLLMLVLAVLDGRTLDLLNAGGYGYWRNSLLWPALILYMLLIQPPLRRLLISAVNSFLPLLPTTERSQKLVAGAYYLNRQREWLAVILGILGGWLLDPPWASPFFALKVYGFVGSGLMYGLIGWVIYSGLVRTRVLATLHGQAQELNLFKQPAPVGPIIRWSLGTAGCLMGGLFLSALFLRPEALQSRTTVIIYSTLTLTAALVLVFSKVPRSLLSRISVFRAMILFFAVAAAGTFGFNFFEGWELRDAFYATIITMTTIGYGDLSPETSSGRLFTIVLSLFAIGIGGYAFSSIAAFMVEGNFNRILQEKKIYKQIDELDDHIILCGIGRVGRQIAVEFYKTGVPFLVIEQDQEILEELLREIDFPYIQGDATQDQILELAGIERARGLVTALSDDKDNAFVVLSAHELSQKLNNPEMRTVSRVNDDKHRKKLEKAGANATISTSTIGGQQMVSAMIHPEVSTFLDEMLQAERQTGQVLRLEEVHVDKINNPILVDRLVRGQLRVIDIGQQTGLLVVVIKPAGTDRDDPYLYTPRGDTLLRRGDVLIVIGTPEERAKLTEAEPPALHEIWLTRAEEAWNKWLDKVTLGH